MLLSLHHLVRRGNKDVLVVFVWTEFREAIKNEVTNIMSFS